MPELCRYRVAKVVDPKPAVRPFLPEPGNRYVSVTFDITSKAAGVLDYRRDQFTVYGDSDFNDIDIPGPKGFAGASIAPGQTKTGTMVFQVPKTEKHIRLHVDPPSSGGAQQVEIRLRR